MDQQEQARVRLSTAMSAAVSAVGRPPGAVPGALPGVVQGAPGVVPGQRSMGARFGAGAGAGGGVGALGAGGGEGVPDGRGPGGRLRVDARRNLESVLRAAREVFGELGYGAPMEEVARRAGVGVGTVYRRFPSKEVLVRRIAAEEVGWLTAQAQEALRGDSAPWEALAGCLSRAVATGAGRLLPPETFRCAEQLSRAGGSPSSGEVPAGAVGAAGTAGSAGAVSAEGGDGFALIAGVPVVRVPEQGPGHPAGGETAEEGPEAWGDADPTVLLRLLGALVERADAVGELRPGVTVADVVLVLTAAVPAQLGAGGGAADRPNGPGSPTDRLLRILLNGLRAG